MCSVDNHDANKIWIHIFNIKQRWWGDYENDEIEQKYVDHQQLMMMIVMIMTMTNDDDLIELWWCSLPASFHYPSPSPPPQLPLKDMRMRIEAMMIILIMMMLSSMIMRLLILYVTPIFQLHFLLKKMLHFCSGGKFIDNEILPHLDLGCWWRCG